MGGNPLATFHLFESFSHPGNEFKFSGNIMKGDVLGKLLDQVDGDISIAHNIIFSEKSMPRKSDDRSGQRASGSKGNNPPGYKFRSHRFSSFFISAETRCLARYTRPVLTPSALATSRTDHSLSAYRSNICHCLRSVWALTLARAASRTVVCHSLSQTFSSSAPAGSGTRSIVAVDSRALPNHRSLDELAVVQSVLAFLAAEISVSCTTSCASSSLDRP
jgi:hypothetical protein